MGIHCEVSLIQPPDGVFTPGSRVRGTVKYTVDEDFKCKQIIMSLKGQGNLSISDRRHRQKGRSLHVYRTSEPYVDEDDVVQNYGNRGVMVPIGKYEITFDFLLPKNIPGSFKCVKSVRRYVVRCKIFYYIRLKFEYGFLRFSKRFKKEIIVVSGITPKLHTEPTVYAEQKLLAQLFSRKKSVVHIKATIENSVVAPGGKIIIDSEVYNDTNLYINCVEIKLVEVCSFLTCTCRKIKAYEDIKQNAFRSDGIAIGDTQNLVTEINVPYDISNIEYSHLMTREYSVIMKVELATYNKDVVLEIPVQIGERDDIVEVRQVIPVDIPNVPPPPYWESMGEDRDEETT